jgi:hypothetical protein
MKTMMEQLPLTGKGFAGPNSMYDEFRQLLRDLVDQQKPMNVRQAFYRAVVKGYVEKVETKGGYSIIQPALAKMRKDGLIPYDWIVDETREVRGFQGSNYESIERYLDEALKHIPDRYFRDLLADHEFSIQVWLEKEALAGVIEPICNRWDVPLVPARGYSSLSLLYEAAQDLDSKNRPAKIFQFGDGDASGQDAMRNVREELPKLAPNTAKLGITFEVVAINSYAQIEEMGLPTRPNKGSDPRSKNFDWPDCAELDAIEPNVLRQIVDDTLRGCFPPGAREAMEARQAAEREEIRRLLERS